MQEKKKHVSSSAGQWHLADCNSDYAPECSRAPEMSCSRRLERQLDTIQEMSGIAFWTYDMKSGRISWSRQVFNLLKHEGVSGLANFHEYLAYYLPEDSLLFRDALDRAIRNCEKQEFEMQASLANGDAALHRCTMVPETDGNQRIIAVLGYLQDVTSASRRQRDTRAAADSGLVGRQPLNGLLPICSHCKKVRDDHGTWKQIEAYITERSNLFFSHGICPECLTIHYSEYFQLCVPAKNENEK